jgi:hypothetical protein
LRGARRNNYHGIVVLELPADADTPMILSLIEGFLRQEAVIRKLPGRLAIVSVGRIRLRPA